MQQWNSQYSYISLGLADLTNLLDNKQHKTTVWNSLETHYVHLIADVKQYTDTFDLLLQPL